MVFRRVVLFLFALLGLLYALVLTNDGLEQKLVLAEYWVPKRSQMPFLSGEQQHPDLKLDNSQLEQLAQVDALAEQMQEEANETSKNTSTLPNIIPPAIHIPETRKNESKPPIRGQKSTTGSAARDTVRRERPIRRLTFEREGYEQLQRFYEHCRAIETTGEEVRIFHYGDSQIEGDRISSYLRTRLQKEFGGGGVGLVSAIPPTYPPFGLTVSASRSWKFYSMMPAHRRKKELHYGVMGSVAQFATDGTAPDSTRVDAEIRIRRDPKAGRGMRFAYCNVLFAAREVPCTMRVVVGDSVYFSRTYSESSSLQRAALPVPADASKFSLQWAAASTPDIYGISYETASGIQVDNMPLRGSGGTDFNAISDTMFREVAQVLAPRLILLEFGVNVVPSRLSSYGAYGRQLQQHIERLKQLLPTAAFVLIGVSDMGFKEDESFCSYPNLTLVRNAQRKAALDAGIAFWDTYEAMGGANAVLRWRNTNPPLVTTDYVHFTPRGARYIAELFYTALMDVYANPQEYQPSVTVE